MKPLGRSADKASVILFFAAFVILVCMVGDLSAGELVRYEYRLVRLGSLSSLQKEEQADARMSEVERMLNVVGLEGWEMVNIFAVRTTFDPNVFFAVMKRPLADGEKEDEGSEEGTKSNEG
jgi:hypothetical protein